MPWHGKEGRVVFWRLQNSYEDCSQFCLTSGFDFQNSSNTQGGVREEARSPCWSCPWGPALPICPGGAVLSPQPGGTARPQLRLHAPQLHNDRPAIFLGTVTHCHRGQEKYARSASQCHFQEKKRKKKKITTSYRKRNESYFPCAESESSDEAIAVLTVDGWHVGHMNNVCENSVQRQLLKHRGVMYIAHRSARQQPCLSGSLPLIHPARPQITGKLHRSLRYPKTNGNI